MHRLRSPTKWILHSLLPDIKQCCVLKRREEAGIF